MTETDLLYREQGPVAVITFNRPDVLNAFRAQTMTELDALFRRVEGSASLRALVLTGAGRAFSAGRDLKDYDALTAHTPVHDEIVAAVEQYQGLTRCLTRMDKVVICALNGAAVGVGAELAVAADVRLAAPQARIAFPEVRRALFLTNGVMYRLPRIVGLGRATEWVLSGRLVDAHEMQASGLVSRVVDAASLVATALETASEMAANAPIPMRLAKELLNRAYDVDLETMLGLERDACVRCVFSEDVREGVRAFLQKRQPTFTGR